MPRDLPFHDVAERNVQDDLSGDAMSPELATEAEREEIAGVYRRRVWDEHPIDNCIRDTGKPPIPVRWVCANKGDSLHPNP